jgi:hypothetical protein
MSTRAERSIHNKAITEMANRRAIMVEANRAKMMLDAKPQLEYMKMMKEIVEKIPSSSDKAKSETVSFFDSKIQDLEVDEAGLPRYLYTLTYVSDMGCRYNGVEPRMDKRDFKTTKEIIHFIEVLILSDETHIVKDTYKIPSPSDVDALLGENSAVKHMMFDINVKEDEDDEDDEDDEGYDDIPIFEVLRVRVNY